MKGEVKQVKAKEVSLPFPKLMIAKDGVVVLFQEEMVGIVVSMNGGNANTQIGEVCNDWLMLAFTDFDGKVTLSND